MAGAEVVLNYSVELVLVAYIYIRCSGSTGEIVVPQWVHQVLPNAGSYEPIKSILG